MKWLSIIPALITIILTFKTKKLIPALVVGFVVGSFFQAKSLVGGFIYVGEHIVGVLSDKGDAYSLIFLLIFGSLSELIIMAGGVSGFSERN